MADSAWEHGIDPAVTKKQQMEEFVKNLKGTTMLEVAQMLILIPVLVILRQVLGLLLNTWLSKPGSAKQQSVGGSDNLSSRNASSRQCPQSSALDAFIDIAVIVVPAIAAMTLVADHLSTLLSFSILLLLLLIAASQLVCHSPIICTMGPSKESESALLSSRKPYLSSYRAVTMLTTITAILAVDFRIFPRRFAKAETFGTGLMDIGVGFFVTSTALVSKQALGLPAPRGMKTLLSFAPLLLLGFARLVLTKGVDYQEHVGEYGVHWNFFFTLAAVALATSAVRVPPQLSGLFGLALLTGYQCLLSLGGWSEYLMSEERERDLFSLNKEGILSIIGYWALYLTSLQMGRFIHLSTPHGPVVDKSKASGKAKKEDRGRRRSEWWTWALQLWLLDALLWVATCLTDIFVEHVSRRSCNMAYVLWTLASSLQVVATFALADVALRPLPVWLLRALDSNMLAVFLLANVLTGLVNMGVDTLNSAPGAAFAILTAYMVTVTGTAMIGYRKGVTLKFW